MGDQDTLHHGQRTAPSRKTILIVDDEWGTADVLAELLNEEGYDTHAVYDAMEAHVAVRRQRPDLVLIDRKIPIQDGLELAHEFAAQGIPVIMVSGSARPDTLCPAIPFLPKPLDVEQLLEVISERVGPPTDENSLA